MPDQLDDGRRTYVEFTRELVGGLVLSGSFYSQRVASQRRGIRSLPEVQTRHA